MLLDDRRLAKLKVILEEQGIEVQDGELESMGVKVARLVLLQEFLKLQQEKAAGNEF